MTPTVNSRITRLPALILVTSLAASGLLLTPLTATAAPVVCSNGGTLISGNICEIRYTAADTFKPTQEMFQVEALLVGSGGSGYVNYSGGSGGGGAGGEVQVVPLQSNQDITVSVSTGPGSTTAITQGQNNVQVSNGAASGNSGHSGNGAGGNAQNTNDGGPGITGAAAGGPGSLFSNDTTVYGSGGSYSNPQTGTAGIPGDGAGAVDPVTVEVTVPAPNRGGGGGGLYENPRGNNFNTNGAGGQVAIRWKENREVTFELNGHGTFIANQTVVLGDAAVTPTAPTATDYTFVGWYVDPELTTEADFSQPISGNTTFYAKWVEVPVPTPSPTTTTPTTEPTSTLEPTQSPEPTQTPEPTPSQTVTSSPEPTASPTETATPKPTPSDNSSGDKDELAQTGNEISGGLVALSVLATGAGVLAVSTSKRRRKS